MWSIDYLYSTSSLNIEFFENQDIYSLISVGKKHNCNNKLVTSFIMANYLSLPFCPGRQTEFIEHYDQSNHQYTFHTITNYLFLFKMWSIDYLYSTSSLNIEFFENQDIYSLI
jgi:hypothetical protein